MNLTVTAGPHDVPGTARSRRRSAFVIWDMARHRWSDEDGSRVPCQLFNERGEDCVAWIERRIWPARDARPTGSRPRRPVADKRGRDRGYRRRQTRGQDRRQAVHPVSLRRAMAKAVPVPVHRPRRHSPSRATTQCETICPTSGTITRTTGRSGLRTARSTARTTGASRKATRSCAHRKFEEVTGGPVFGRIRSVNSWVSCRRREADGGRARVHVL